MQFSFMKLIVTVREGDNWER